MTRKWKTAAQMSQRSSNNAPSMIERPTQNITTPRQMLDCLKNDRNALQVLHNKLHSCNTDWIISFIKEGGVKDLTDLLSSEIEQSSPLNNRIDQCVKALSIVILTIDNGVAAVDARIVYILAELLDHSSTNIRIDVLFLLATIARLEQKSYQMVLQGTRNRLKALLHTLYSSNDTNYLFAVLDFLFVLLKGTHGDQRKDLIDEIGRKESEDICNKLLETDISDKKIIQSSRIIC
jgi:hypothetical protein